MKKKILRTGHSLAVTIPSKFAKIVGAKPGDEVLVQSKIEEGKLLITFGGVRQLTFVKDKKI